MRNKFYVDSWHLLWVAIQLWKLSGIPVTPCRASGCWRESYESLHVNNSRMKLTLPLGWGKLFVLHKTFLIAIWNARCPTLHHQSPVTLSVAIETHVVITSTITCRQAISFQVEHAQTGCLWARRPHLAGRCPEMPECPLGMPSSANTEQECTWHH